MKTSRDIEFLSETPSIKTKKGKNLVNLDSNRDLYIGGNGSDGKSDEDDVNSIKLASPTIMDIELNVENASEKSLANVEYVKNRISYQQQVVQVKDLSFSFERDSSSSTGYKLLEDKQLLEKLKTNGSYDSGKINTYKDFYQLALDTDIDKEIWLVKLVDRSTASNPNVFEWVKKLKLDTSYLIVDQQGLGIFRISGNDTLNPPSRIYPYIDLLAPGASSLLDNSFIGSTSDNPYGTGFIVKSAAQLATKIKIGGVEFDGTADINLPGVNIEGNQNTSGNAATATTASNVSSTVNGKNISDIFENNGTTVKKATNDSNGNNISSTYMPKSGGTFTGNITAQNIDSTGYTITANTYIAKSDKRLKENITPYNCEKSILDLPIYKYNFISDENKKIHIGCLAQDLQEICPEIVNTNDKGHLAIEESKIVYLLLEEVKKLRKEIDELKNGG